MPRHILCGVVPEGAVEGRLGGYARCCLSVQGIRRPAQSNQDVAPAGGVPEGLGQGVRLGAGRPLGGEHLSGRDALAHQDPHPPCRSIPDAPPPRDSKGAPQNACQPDTPAWARITRYATAVRRVSVISTTSARQSATVCQCRRKEVTFASATCMGPGWGSTSPHLNDRRGGKAQHRGGGGGAGGGAGGGEVPRPPSWSRPAPGGAALPRRLRPLLYRQPPTIAWGPVPLPGQAPAPGGDLVPSPRPGAPSEKPVNAA